MFKEIMFSDYRKLIAKVDKFCEKGSDKYADEIACKKGCADCCNKILTFFPVEFFNIIEYIQLKNIDENIIVDNIDSILAKESKDCPLLHNDECMIYDARPVICRTFGLPAIVKDDVMETVDIQICDKNFLTEGLELENDYIINLDTLNSMLFIINSVFVKVYKGFAQGDDARLSVLEIVNYI